jgi:hypothetical protein
MFVIIEVIIFVMIARTNQDVNTPTPHTISECKFTMAINNQIGVVFVSLVESKTELDRAFHLSATSS